MQEITSAYFLHAFHRQTLEKSSLVYISLFLQLPDTFKRGSVMTVLKTFLITAWKYPCSFSSLWSSNDLWVFIYVNFALEKKRKLKNILENPFIVTAAEWWNYEKEQVQAKPESWNKGHWNNCNHCQYIHNKVMDIKVMSLTLPTPVAKSAECFYPSWVNL